ncbi:helix-turn-helix domain-containing protein [Sediminispirochaeta smaragdinae]|uniref:helix-turn-helix domain-containing protein n=1 Tax=Sediminispirochaeta smaragdinae TaxID=55206 RepID=UPI001C0A8BF4
MLSALLGRILSYIDQHLADPGLTPQQDLAKTGHIAQTVTDIAFRWGFNDVSHFNRVFKRTFQITPSQYRKITES